MPRPWLNISVAVSAALCAVQFYVLCLFDKPNEDHHSVMSDMPGHGVIPLNGSSSLEQSQSTELVHSENSSIPTPVETHVNVSSPHITHTYTKLNEDEDYFSACLLIMDDNHLLPEWLAYHYTFLPLRRLIVAVDPYSKTSPEEVLARFSPYMNITIWEDADFRFKINHDDTRKHNHRGRQQVLIRRCMEQLKREERPNKWVAFLDTDEFVVPNWQAKEEYLIKEYNPKMTVLEMMKANPESHYLEPGSPCFPKNRFRLTIKESQPEQVYKDVPEGLNANSLMTLRYRYALGGKQSDYGKSFVDISQLNSSDFTGFNHAVHRPVLSHCPQDTLKIPFRRSPFVVFHYAGTLESFLFRQDPRNKRNQTSYFDMFGNSTGSYEDDSARFWISNFVEKVGSTEKAKELLANAGDVTVKYRPNLAPPPQPKAVEARVNVESARNTSDTEVNEEEEYFSACLLIMDDNHLLPEWLAYHYTFLPLRRLIVAVDPYSKTSPTKVLARFLPYMNITLWDDDDLGFKIDHNDTRTHNHRARQKTLIRKCLKQLKHEDLPNKWVAFLDTDEFVVPNWQAKEKYVIKDYNPNMTVSEIMKANPDSHLIPGSPCFPKNRFRMTIKESEHEQIYKDVPKGINADSLMTLRYRYSLGGIQSDYGKSFVDLSQLNNSHFHRQNHAVHRPVVSICPQRTLKIPFRRSPFVVYHFAGTLESFLYREDPRNRRNETSYLDMFGNTTGAYEDDSARFWISNFVKQVGSVEKANKLLAGAGDVTIRHAPWDDDPVRR